MTRMLPLLMLTAVFAAGCADRTTPPAAEKSDDEQGETHRPVGETDAEDDEANDEGTQGGAGDYLGAVVGAQQFAKVRATEAQIKHIGNALQAYATHVGELPDSLQALRERPEGAKQWAGPYFSQDLEDVWGAPYRYQRDGDRYTLTSAGPDGKFGTGDDISAK